MAFTKQSQSPNLARQSHLRMSLRVKIGLPSVLSRSNVAGSSTGKAMIKRMLWFKDTKMVCANLLANVVDLEFLTTSSNESSKVIIPQSKVKLKARKMHARNLSQA